MWMFQLWLPMEILTNGLKLIDHNSNVKYAQVGDFSKLYSLCTFAWLHGHILSISLHRLFQLARLTTVCFKSTQFVQKCKHIYLLFCFLNFRRSFELAVNTILRWYVLMSRPASWARAKRINSWPSLYVDRIQKGFIDEHPVSNAIVVFVVD